MLPADVEMRLKRARDRLVQVIEFVNVVEDQAGGWRYEPCDSGPSEDDHLCCEEYEQGAWTHCCGVWKKGPVWIVVSLNEHDVARYHVGVDRSVPSWWALDLIASLDAVTAVFVAHLMFARSGEDGWHPEAEA